MGKNQPDYITKDDLRQLYKDLRKDLRADIRRDVNKDMHGLLDRQTELIRDELDYKLNALESRINDQFTGVDAKLISLQTRLMAHTEEVVGNSAVDLLDNIASVLDPKGTGIKGWKHRHFRNT